MNTTNFRDALAYENSRMKQADQYYKDIWKAIDIKRWSWNDPEGREYQQEDIDVSVTLPGGRTVNISEKFYSKDYGNFVVEISSNNKPGWGITSNSDGICVFTPDNCYEVNTEDVQRIIPDSLPDNCTDKISIGSVEADIRTVISRAGKNTWKGKILCIKWEDLEKLHIKFKKRSL